jgi:hypothetical protein
MLSHRTLIIRGHNVPISSLAFLLRSLFINECKVSHKRANVEDCISQCLRERATLWAKQGEWKGRNFGFSERKFVITGFDPTKKGK